jgi:16S rRNA (adenine(1408)-N(1))-methyltransferase
VVIDLGTGSGQQVLRRARLNPEELVIGVDADSRAMAESSRRAAASPRRGGLSNALFLAAAAEELPGCLTHSADLITVALPWGSLLRGLLAADATLIAGISSCLGERAELELLLSATERDAAAGPATLASDQDAACLVTRLESAGISIVECRLATQSDVARLSSGWGNRLGIPARRAAWLLRARRRPGLVPCSTRRAGERAPIAPSRAD